MPRNFRPFVLLACALAASGCNGDGKWPWDKSSKKPAPRPAALDPRPVSQSFEGTIRSYGYIDGMRKLRVRGYGLVGGLANTGGSDCPDEIRKHLEAEIRRQRNIFDLDIDPRDILSSPRFAPVVVTGDIPAAAVKGERFDLIVSALGNQTTSLEGGRLYLCDLKLFQPTTRGVIQGRRIARAEGPVYVSPFGQEEKSATKSNPRQGRVLGGGSLDEDRRVQLILNSPSYGIAARIRDRVNARFGAAKPIADAISPSRVRLTIPDDYRTRTRLFLDLVLHTPMASDPAMLQQKAGALADEIIHPLAAYEDIALTWEAIGRSAVPSINRLYNHRVSAAAYYAARTGLRLGDDIALEVVARHANDSKSPFHEPAIRELGIARTSRAADVLAQLLDSPDNRVRILAYESLLNRRDSLAIRTERIWDDNLTLDTLESNAPPLIYVRQSAQQRIAQFGRGLALNPPLMYSYPIDPEHDLVTLSARAAEDQVWVVRRNPVHNRVSDPMPAPLDLSRLIAFLAGPPRVSPEGVTGVGLSYSVVVDFLNAITSKHILPATLIMERPLLADSAGRSLSRERPESEF